MFHMTRYNAHGEQYNAYKTQRKGLVTQDEGDLVRGALARVDGLSDYAAATKIGVSEPTVRRWRKGKIALPLREPGKSALYRFMGVQLPARPNGIHVTGAIDLFRDIDMITRYVRDLAPPGQQKALKRDVLEGLRRIITAREPLPQWWKDLYEMVEKDEV